MHARDRARSVIPTNDEVKVNGAITRFQFLRGDRSGRKQEIRPPWAIAEARFTAGCSRCGDCVAACPERILRIGRGGYPRVDFSLGECTFCGDCRRACPRGALWDERQRDGAPWNLKATIGDHCLATRGVECRVCGEQCPGNAIHFRPRRGGPAFPRLEAGSCNGCGACFSTCPAAAIEMRAWNQEVTA